MLLNDILCNDFYAVGDIRFCPCCAMVSCSSCVSKRVFEVVSRQVVSVCIHCYRVSSRIRQPPEGINLLFSLKFVFGD